MSLNNIRISAILPNYNSAEFLSKSVKSLAAQTEPFSEIIIIDDGSTDHSLSIIHQLMKEHSNIKLIQHEKNLGVCRSLNDGIQAAVGDYVLLCAADDWYEKDIVLSAKQVITQYPDIGLVGGDAIVHRFDKSSSFKRSLCFSRKNSFISSTEFRAAVKKGYVGFNGGGIFINRQAALAAGLLFQELKWCCDWLLHFVIAFRAGFYYCDKVFVNVLLRQESYSEGKNNWEDQGQVILSLLKIINEHYPELWDSFKEAALLPGYHPKYISLWFKSSLVRRFFTLHLIWRCLINNQFIVRIGRLFPYPLIKCVRKFLYA